MPIRNEAASIGCSLGAVLAQGYPAARMEVLVVDGCSKDATRDIVRSLADNAAARGLHVALLDNPSGIVPAALNAAIRAARGDVIVRVDGHCVVASDYVERCVAALSESRADNVGGVQAAYGLTTKERAIAAANSSPFGVPAPFRYRGAPGRVDTVYLGTYRRETLLRLGGFDEELVRNQDDELNHRLRQGGGTIWFDPSLRVAYRSRATFRALARQYFQYGMYKVRVFQKRGSLPSVRALVPPAFVAGVVGATVLARWTWWPLAALAAAYLCWLIAAAVTSRSRGPAERVLAAVAIVTMHVAYGIGFWYGCVRFASGFVKRG